MYDSDGDTAGDESHPRPTEPVENRPWCISPEEAGFTTEDIHPVAPPRVGDGSCHGMSGRNFVDPKAL